MVILGEAFINVKMKDEFSSAVAHTGDQVEKQVGDKSEHATGRARAAFKAMSGTLLTSFSPALGPVQELIDKVDTFGTATEGIKGKVSKSLLGIGAAATATGTLLVTMGDKDKIAMGQLKDVVGNAGGSWDEYSKKTEETIHHEEHFGYTAVDTAKALGTLVSRTGKVSESYNNMQLVTDLASQKHVSLSNAAGIVARVMNGNTKTLKQYGITTAEINKLTDTGVRKQKEDALSKLQTEIATEKLEKINTKDKATRAQLTASIATNTIKAKDLQKEIKTMTASTDIGRQASDLLAKKLAGQASVAADTFTGRMKEARAKIEDFASTVGQKVGPAIQAAGPVMMGLGAIIESGIIGKLGRGVKAFKEFMEIEKLQNAIAKISTGVNVALGLSEDAALGPIILIVAGIALLAGGFILAYMKIKPFHDLVNIVAHDLKQYFLDALHAVTSAFKDFVKFFEDVWKTVVGIIKKYGPIILAVTMPFIGLPLLIIQHWNVIAPFFEKLWHTVSSFVARMAGDVVGAVTGMWHNAIGAIANLVNSAVSWFQGLPGRIASGLGNLASTVGGAISRGLSGLKQDAINQVAGAGSWLISAGNSVIQGLINGITSMAGSLVSAVTSTVVNSIPAPIRKVLKMLSPSKVMEEIGLNVVQGMAGGITKNKHLVANASSAMAAGAIPAISGPGVHMAGHGGAGGRIINLFPNATIDFGHNSPAAVVQKLEAALVASRL
ncbi:MAG TPA: hypothetical protein VH187_22360 [Scandinavium sp.]|jgi:hypothetical protein|uniref:phage tail protein n=1 Tax=Scandinavium sp. TaxID=2830653 RepID=UPI002E365EB0|nr:hypothetical protein [Scandinavium sp.]HEX4503879.1 hypothetical protein [Scandinavium sp.]